MLDPATVQILFADLQPAIVARSKTNPPQSLSCAGAATTSVRWDGSSAAIRVVCTQRKSAGPAMAFPT